MLVRKHYFVSGSVQGVGFRYRAYYTAQHLGITGYAKNLYDGRVELELQGEPEAIRLFFDKMAAGTFIEITDLESYDMEPVEERGFAVG